MIEALAEKEGVKIEKKLGILKIDSINPTSHLYELAILATYGANKTKSTDNLVTDLTNGTILADKSEDVSLLFGLNNGYFKLSNKYKGSEKYINVKFTLESKLDYYIIESIYQFVFNNSKQSYSFDYIDTWCPSINLKDKVKGYDTYKILDTVVIAKKKQTPLDFFLENYSGEIYSTITKSVNQWLAPFAKVEEKLLTEHFKKQFLKTFTNSIIEIQQKIESECEENNDSQMQHETTLHKNEIDKLLFKILNLQEENEKIKKEFNLLKISGHLSKPVQNTDDEKEIDQETSNLISTVEIYETNVSSNDNDKGIVFKDSISANMLQNNDVEISVKEESVSLRDLHNLKETEKILFNEYTIPLDLDKKDISEISVIEKLTSLPVFINPNNSEKENIKQPSAIDLIDNYLSLSFPKLKNIAKHRGISDAALQMFTKSNINELIALIRNTPEPPKLL